MFSKLTGIVTSIAITLVLAVPSFAFGFFPHNLSLQDSINIENEKTMVDNLVVTKANSGENTINANTFMGSAEIEQAGITTNDAIAGADLQNQVNYNEISTCSLCSIFGSKVNIENEKTMLDNTVITKANSGENRLSSGSMFRTAEIEHSGITTGVAKSTSLVTNIVNSNIVGGVLTPSN